MTRVPFVLALFCALAQAHDVAESHTARVVDLPVSDQATALDVSESLVIDVFRIQDALRNSGSADPLANWRGAGGTGTSDAAYGWFEQRLTASLGGLAKSAAGTRTAVVVRADARAP